MDRARFSSDQVISYDTGSLHTVIHVPEAAEALESVPLRTPTANDELECLAQRQDELHAELLGISRRIDEIRINSKNTGSSECFRAKKTSDFTPPKAQSSNDSFEQHLPVQSAGGPPSHVPAFSNPGENLPHLLNLVMGLPKKEIPRFNGDSADYWRFYRAFTHGVAKYTDDSANRLSYLINYCEGKARKSIEHCTILEPEEGYKEAWRILERCYGQPFMIASKLVSSITEGPRLRSDDDAGLLSLAESMEACEITLRQLNFDAELNTRTVMSAVVSRLPDALQSRWFDVASSSLLSTRIPKFSELTRFIRERADAASTRRMYMGKPATSHPESRQTIKEFNVTDKDRNVDRRTFTLATVSQPSSNSPYRPNCVKCRSKHYLDECNDFLSLSPTDKLTYVTHSSLCICCLKPKHDANHCKSRKICGFNGCTMQHHPLLHFCLKNNEAQSTRSSNDVLNANINAGLATCLKPVVALGVVPVVLEGPTGEIRVNALLDSGSDATLISKRIMQKIGLAGENKVVTLTTLHGERRTEACRVTFSLKPVNAHTRCTMNAWAVQDLPKVTALNPTEEQRRRWKHLESIELPVASNEPIELLLGMDVPILHWVIESRFGEPSDPYAVRTRLGWILLGPVTSTTQNAVLSNNLILDEDDILTKLQTAYHVEFSEAGSEKPGHSQDDRLAVETVREGVKLIDGHYQVPLPWKLGYPFLRSNRVIAVKRLQQLSSRLTKDLRLHEQYRCAMDEYLERGYAELAPSPSIDDDRNNVWYLPHHPVFHPQKPNKVRVVFDCACSFKGNCLNKQLLSGPDIGNCLFGVLLRFRQSPYVFAADIEAMFHQVKVPVEQRRYLRFLWWKNGDMSLEPTEFQMTSHPFGATSSPFCASFALQKTLEENETIFDNDDANEVKRSFYVDDCLFSADSVERLVRVAHQLKTALSQGGFNLTKWSSNVEELLLTIPSNDRAMSITNTDCQPTTIKRMLGVEWDLRDDVFRFRVEPAVGIPTRRNMLAYIASIFDPLGLMSPVVLPGRLLLQELTRLRLGWDENLDDSQESQWRNWSLGLDAVTNMAIPRCIRLISSGSQNLQLHCFSDASVKAYGVAIYLRSVSSSGVIRCSLVCGKSRVAPLKSITIPRLELTAAVLAARLGAQVKEDCTLPITSLTFWTDSMIVLQMIRNRTTRFPVFVANRLSIIHEYSVPEQWCYVDGRQNPADLASRGVTAFKLKTTCWLTGPDFLSLESDRWPNVEIDPDCNDLKTELQTATVSACITRSNWFDRFSHIKTWYGLVRTVAWLRKFCVYIKNRRHSGFNIDRFLTVKELTEASMCITRCVQFTAFENELRILQEHPTKNKRVLLSAVSPLRKLNPFLHQGVLRVGGRLEWSFLSFEAKHPVILPRRHYVTRLLIEYHHNLAGHVGTSQVLAAIRERYWILQGTAAVKSVVSSCFYCRRWFSRPCHQIMAPLPLERTESLGRPFSFTGVDYFGPLLVRRGRGTEKRYGCLFTCMSIRAVHIEVTQALDTDSFLCAFFRFVARRGNPIKIFSDNGTNFRGAEAEVKLCLRAWDQDQIRKKLSERDCDWKFSTPKASHQGGVWERQIRSVRRILRGLLGERLVDDQTLQTALVEVEKIINDRPIVKLTSDPNDFTALTPSHLLLLHSNQATLPSEFNSLTLNKRWMKSQQLADLFWSRWRKEYLPNLITCQKWLKKGMNLQAGDLVLLTDENAHRGDWKKGVVVEAIKSGDDVVRRVLVRTCQGTRLRDVRQLCMLEAHGEPMKNSISQISSKFPPSAGEC